MTSTSKRPTASCSSAVLLLLVLAACSRTLPSTRMPTRATPETMASSSQRVDRDGVIRLELAGAPAQLGRPHGQLLAAEIAAFRDVLRTYLEKETGKPWRFFRDAAERRIWPRVPADLRAEIDAMAAGVADAESNAQVDRADLVVLNAFSEIAYGYLPWTVRGERGPRAPRDATGAAGRFPRRSSPHLGLAVMASGAQTRRGGLVVGHSHFMSYALGRFRHVVLDVSPQNGERFVMETLPGVISPLHSLGFNAQGIVLVSSPFAQFLGYDPLGVPTFVRCRHALERAASIDDALTLLAHNGSGGETGQFLVGHAGTGEMARLELGLVHAQTQRSQGGYFLADGLPDDERIRQQETALGDTRRLVARRNRIESKIRGFKGKLDVEALKRLLSDHGDQGAPNAAPTASTVCAHGEADPQPRPEWGDPAGWPAGAVTATVTDARLVATNQLWLIPGHPCGAPLAAPPTDIQSSWPWLMPLLPPLPAASTTWMLVGPATPARAAFAPTAQEAHSR